MVSRVNRTYLVGAIEFYARVPGNPWQAAHDNFEKAMSAIAKDDKYFQNIQGPLTTFESSLLDLIQRFRPFSAGAKGTPQSIGFYSPTPEVAAARHSCQDRFCAMCEGNQNLRIYRHPQHGLGVYCTTCIPNPKR